MRIAIVITPKDFKDESVSRAKLLIEKGGVEPVITSYSSKDCVGSHGAVYKPVINTARVNPIDFDGLLLIDGSGIDDYRLYDFRPLLDLVKQFTDSNKIVGSIGNATKVIARANVIMESKIAMPRDKETEKLVRLYKGIPSENNMEYGKNIITISDYESIGELVDGMLSKIGAK